MFKDASQFDESELLQMFLKRMKIMNRQHFRYIEKLMKSEYGSDQKQVKRERETKKPNKI